MFLGKDYGAIAESKTQEGKTCHK